MLERFCDFRSKEVINILDGKRLGCVCDLILDTATGQISAIIVPTCGKLASFFRGGDDIVIPWRKIIKIGNDVILCEADLCVDGCR